MRKRILLRVDASASVGLGHFFRSLHLADYLNSQGHHVSFAHIASEFWQNLTDFPFPAIALSEDNAEEVMLQHIKEYDIDVFYVDGMLEFSERFVKEAKKDAVMVFYQNLTPGRKDADVYFLPSIYQDEEFFNVFNVSAKIYKGLEYFTFNPVIENITRKKEQKINVTRIAVAAGGSDPYDVLRKVWQCLSKSSLKNNIVFTFYYGESYFFINGRPEDTANMRFEKFSLEGIKENDILITAFGVSAYEFIYLQVPVISMGYNNTHNKASKVTAEKTSAFLHLGLIDELVTADFEKAVESMLPKNVRDAYAERSKDLLDLNGVKRVANVIEKL